uniref:Uncharacterized protein n=1 Tax=Ditylenchus dipsaci TaxID=166011 RepID=A0A915DSV0_9BILA
MGKESDHVVCKECRAKHVKKKAERPACTTLISFYLVRMNRSSMWLDQTWIGLIGLALQRTFGRHNLVIRS